MGSNGYKRMIRKMGFISDQEGIIHRYQRERDNWDTHLKHTRDFIKESLEDKQIQSVAVLGSGWLLDIPIKSLSKRFKKVLLVDVYHPPQAKKKAEKYANVEFQQTDLSGGAAEFAWKIRKSNSEFFSKHVLDDFSPEKPKLKFQPDAILSVNILNQLDILIVDFIKKRHNAFLPEEYDRFRKTIQAFHLNWISGTPGCLISDMIELREDAAGKTKSVNLIHATLPEFKRAEEWTWDFDLSGTYHPNLTTRFAVRALEW